MHLHLRWTLGLSKDQDMEWKYRDGIPSFFTAGTTHSIFTTILSIRLAKCSYIIFQKEQCLTRNAKGLTIFRVGIFVSPECTHSFCEGVRHEANDKADNEWWRHLLSQKRSMTSAYDATNCVLHTWTSSVLLLINSMHIYHTKWTHEQMTFKCC